MLFKKKKKTAKLTDLYWDRLLIFGIINLSPIICPYVSGTKKERVDHRLKTD